MADKIRVNSKYDLQGEYQPSDSEDDYSPTDKKLLEKVRKRKKQQSDSEEEVYALSASEEDESDGKEDFDMADSDVEGQEKSDDDLPDSKAWGKKKRSYYSTDFVDEDYGGFGEDEEAALLEEQEAKNIQQRLLQQLGDEDFSLDFFTTKKAEQSADQETVIKSDLSQLSKRQKLQLLEKESPEFSGLIDDFKTKLTVAKDDLKPVLNLVKVGKLPKCPASKFVKTNYDLILNYCTNISFYLLLKAKKISIHNHPVIKKLYQYRQMLNKMEPIYLKIIKPQIDSIMSAIDNDIELVITDVESKGRKRKSEKTSESSSKKLKLISSLSKQEGEDTGVSDDDDEYEGHDFLKSNESKKVNSESEESGFSDNDEDDKQEDEEKDEEIRPSTSSDVQLPVEDIGEKREITYQIAKNKGLTPHRKKDQRNPRVKHKLKYRKAKIRRKGAVREPRKEVTRYGGEVSGIKANVKKSIKIK